MKLIKLVVFQMIVGILFAFFFARLTIPEFKKFQVKILDIRGGRSFQLPERGTYLLNIFGDNIPEKVYFNSKRIVHSIFRNRAKLKEFYYIITPEFATKGINSILILPDDRYSIKILNNISSTDFGAVLFKSSVTRKAPIPFYIFLLFVFIFIVWGLCLSYLIKKLFGLSLDSFFIRYCLTYFPCILLLYLFDKAAIFLPAKLLFFERSYLGVISVLILLFQILVIFTSILPTPLQQPSKNKYFGLLMNSSRSISKQLAGYRAVAWVIKRDFSDKFILFFMFLLFFSAFLLCINLSFIAEFFANIAYLSLLAGVIIKLKNAGSHADEERPA